MRIILLSLLFFLAASTRAGGIEVSNHSSRAMALGGTFVATADDASSIYANPAAMSFSSGTHLSVGATIMLPETEFTLASAPGNTWKTQSQVLFPPDVSLTHSFDNGFAIGVAASVPFYVKDDWPADWAASRVSTHTDIRVVFLSPTISAKLSPSLSLGVSLNVAFAHLSTSRGIGFEDAGQPQGILSMDGSSETSFGYGAGLLFHPNDVWSLGAAYRSRVPIRIEGGDISFAGVPSALQAIFPNSQFATRLTTPDHITAGLGCRPFKGLALSGEVQYMYWSTLSSMKLTFADPALQANPRIENDIPLHWKNAMTARGGIELTIGSVALRAGYGLEQTPVPEPYMRPSMPDANRRVLSGGIGYAVSEDLHVDFACSYSRFEQRSIDNSLVEYLPGTYLNGTYASSLTMIGISMSYSWNN